MSLAAFSGTAGATAAEFAFNGLTSPAPRAPAKRVRVNNLDGADTLQVSFDQQKTWIDVDAGVEKIWEAGGKAVISNSRNSLWIRRKAGGGDAGFEGDCILDPTRIR